MAQLDRDLFSVVQRKVLTANGFTSRQQVVDRLDAFEHHYNQVAEPLGWTFARHARHDLELLIARAATHEPRLRFCRLITHELMTETAKSLKAVRPDARPTGSDSEDGDAHVL